MISALLYPMALLYGSLIYIQRFVSRTFQKDFGIKIISIGNVSIGGSGKTPFVIELINKLDLENTAIILRGYKRSSKGLIIISDKGNILTNINQSGDEAMLLATSLTSSTIIVSENRKKAILKAKSLGVKYIFLDDGFSKTGIKKYDIVLESNDVKNKLPLPSGSTRGFYSMINEANLVLKENTHYFKITTTPKIQKETILITAISKGYRLEKYLPKDMKKVYFPDHHQFVKDEILFLCEKYKTNSIITTSKDYIKLKQLNLQINIELMTLKIEINKNEIKKIQMYLHEA